MKALILDMYGVIIKDPEGGFLPFINHYLPNITREYAYLHWDKADLGEISSLDLFRNLGFTGDLNDIEHEYLETIEINDAFYDFALKINNGYRLALLSNDLSQWSKYLREKYNLNKYFDVISVSGDLKIKKPDERIFKLTTDKLGLPAADCIYVDDRRYNLAAAQSLGMDVILFNTRNVEYEGKTVYNFEELADILIKL